MPNLSTPPKSRSQDPPFYPTRIAQSATDLAWKTILSSVVDVEGVGEVGVAKVLQEIWKRGGGDIVSLLAKRIH